MTIEAGALALRITETGADQVLQKLDMIDKKARGLGQATQQALQFNAPSATGVNGQLQAMTMNFSQMQNAAGGATNALNTNTAAQQQNKQATQSSTASLVENVLTYQMARQVLNDVGRVIAFVTEAADNQTLAQRRLSSVSRLTGTDLAFLQGVSADARKEFRLSTASADELTGQFVKLSSRAGHVAQTGQLMTAWLDLSAANGLTLDVAMQALTTTLAGQDEGLNKIGLMDPGQIWKKWAEAAGMSVGQMTQQQKWQAIVNEVVEQGAKVNGEYLKSLTTVQGSQNAFNETLKDTAAMFGHTLDAGRTSFYGLATAAMQAALTVDKWWKGVGETMRTSITGFLEKYPLLAKLARLTGDLPPEAAKNPVASLESTPNVGAAALQAQLDAAAGFTRPGPKLTAEEKAAARERAKEIQKAMGVDATGLGEIVLTDHGPAGPMVAPTVGVGKDGKMKGLGKVPEIIDKEFDALAKKLKQKGEFINGIIQNVAGMVGNAFGNAFQAAFEGGNFFAELGKGLLSGIGQMVMQLGEQMLTYGLIMAAGAPLLMMTPFAGQAMSAPAAIAAGIALTALGAGMGALGGKGGKGGGAGSGGGHGGAPSQQDNTFALQFDPDGKLRKASKGPSVIPSSRALTNSAMPDARPVVQIGTLNALHPDDPRWQREIASTVKNAQNRGLLKAS